KPFFQQYERRDLLYLAVMLHDVGKSKRQDHIVCGVEMTRELGRRLRLAEEDLDFLLFQVEHHQEMVILSQRRDLDDYKMIAEFASLFPSMEWLQGLYLLSYADLSAVSADAWTDWQGALLWELYHKTGEQLESGMKTLEQMQQGRHLLDEHLKAVSGKWPAPRVMAFQEHAEKLPPRYLAAYSREQIENHLQLVDRSTDDSLFEVEFVERPTFTEMLICTPDQRQLLAKICGALAVNDVNILRAEINTRADDVVLDIFQVTDVDGSPILPDWKKERICERLEEVIALRQKARELLERYSAHWERRKQQKRAYVLPPVLQIENQISDRYTVIDLDVQDDVGLLYEITHCLSELGLDIHMAIVNTIANRARDGFYVVDGQGEKIVNYQVLEEIRQDLLEKLAD
ncbi:MAG: HD domain-containing protein, partial [Gemmatimonadetes bacterium]|nr:HD domain-containing protein [Gemmatimonadota bacterium]